MQQNIENKFKEIFSKKNGPQKASRPSFGADPAADWKKLIIIFIILNILVMGWNGFIFWQINSGGIFGMATPSNGGNNQNAETSLRNTLNIYDAREKHFEDLRAAPPATNDPAI